MKTILLHFILWASKLKRQRQNQDSKDHPDVRKTIFFLDYMKSSVIVIIAIVQHVNHSFFISDWCDGCQRLFFEMFFRGLTWFRGHELHFVQVRVKGSCQTEIPNWRYKWTVDNTDIGCVFIRFDSPSSSLSPSLSPFLCSYGSLKGWTLPDCKWLADWRKRNQACDYFPELRPLSHTQTYI